MAVTFAAFLDRLRALGFDCQPEADGEGVLVTDLDRPIPAVRLFIPEDLFEELMASREPYADNVPPERRDESALDDAALDFLHSIHDTWSPLVSVTLSRSSKGLRWREVRGQSEGSPDCSQGSSWVAFPTVEGEGF